MTLSNMQTDSTWRPSEKFAARKNSYAPDNSPTADGFGSFSKWEPKVEQHPEPPKITGQSEEGINNLSESDDGERPAAESAGITPTQLEEKLKGNYDLGFADGKRQAEEALQSHREQLLELMEGFRKAQSDLSTYYSPMVKLAVAIAEQLVRAELSFSHAAVEGLVRKILAEIEALAEGPVSVWMNPQDLEVARDVLQKEYAHVSFEPDAALSRASVRAVMDDTAIEDIRESRLEHLVTDMVLQKKALEDGSSIVISDQPDEIDTEAVLPKDGED
jgi:flagellar biosynthesis/type III secretory pathway protein FliH